MGEFCLLVELHREGSDLQPAQQACLFGKAPKLLINIHIVFCKHAPCALCWPPLWSCQRTYSRPPLCVAPQRAHSPDTPSCAASCGCSLEGSHFTNRKNFNNLDGNVGKSRKKAIFLPSIMQDLLVGIHFNPIKIWFTSLTFIQVIKEAITDKDKTCANKRFCLQK